MFEHDATTGAIPAQKSLNDAMNYHMAGRFGQAEQAYVQVLTQDYRTSDVLPLLAGIVAKRGDANMAIYYWDKLLALAPDNILALLEKGALLRTLKRFADAIICYEMALLASPNNSLALNNLAVVLDEAGRPDEALKVFESALALQPDNVDLQHQIRRLASRIVPFWHIAMMNDTRRNDAFAAAIKRALALRGAGAQVLDIGAGSGLLSMMAAREGAADIVTCETVAVIAETATRIIRQNGYADQVKVVGKPSTMLSVGQDIARRADILVSEILSSDLLAEHVLATFEDAHARLIADDAIIIPKAASAIGCLVASENLAAYSNVGQVSGFDLSAFNCLAPERLPLHGTMTSWQRLSGDFEITAVDLTKKSHSADLRKISIPVLATGTAIGVVQWMNIALIDDITFSNHPDDYHDGGWLQVLHTFPAPIDITAGEELSLVVGHDRTSLIITPVQ
jgi:type II protein arginine methyltransferase